MKPAPTLVLACGNPSRGDDALGPLFIDALERDYAAEIAAGELECRWDFQWQIEDALRLAGRSRVLFVDASADAASCGAWLSVQPAARPGVLSHALTPAQLLAVYREVQGEPEFAAEVLGISGASFTLGEGLSESAKQSFEQARKRFGAWWRGEPDCRKQAAPGEMM